MFESGAFGYYNPEALQRTLWWFFSLHFGFRVRDESRKLCWGDLELQTDPETGREILLWLAERGERLAKDWKVRTSASLIRKYLPREQSSAHSNISRFSKVTVLNKPKLQPTLYFWPETTTLGILNPLSTRCRLSAKTKLANSCRKQPKKLACKPVKENFPSIQ